MKYAISCLLGIAIGAGAMLPWNQSVKQQRDELAAKVIAMTAEKEQMLNVMAGKDAALVAYGRRPELPPTPEQAALAAEFDKNHPEIKLKSIATKAAYEKKVKELLSEALTILARNQ